MKSVHSATAAFLIVLASPLSAAASVRMTEIMYDNHGADTGREWIELTNTGVNAADLAGYTIAQRDVHHKLVFSGRSLLAPGAAAVVAASPEKFAVDHQGGLVIKSAISLPNTGDTLVLKDASGAIVDTVSYTRAYGAAGDGMTLRLGSGWQAGPPAPWKYPDPPPPKAVEASARTEPEASPKPARSESAPPDETVPVPAHAAAVASADPGGTSSILLQSLAGLTAVILIAVSAVLLVQRRGPQPQEAIARSEEKQESAGHTEADEYDLVESPNKFLSR